ncbi:MAG TPA: V-type ATP synthase subunit D, partial [Nitrospiria bacterium]|nr:V-type ATP synthase subunit D [Nitrospiria bacterium]
MEKVSPTRMNLLKIKDRAVLARNGLELMRNKRAALVREILRVKDSVLEHRGRLRNAMQGAMNSLTVALGLDDRPAVESAAMAARRDLPVELTEKNVWG